MKEQSRCPKRSIAARFRHYPVHNVVNRQDGSRSHSEQWQEAGAAPKDVKTVATRRKACCEREPESVRQTPPCWRFVNPEVPPRRGGGQRYGFQCIDEELGLREDRVEGYAEFPNVFGNALRFWTEHTPVDTDSQVARHKKVNRTLWISCGRELAGRKGNALSRYRRSFAFRRDQLSNLSSGQRSGEECDAPEDGCHERYCQSGA